jgi:hypothetical protein
MIALPEVSNDETENAAVCPACAMMLALYRCIWE